MHIDGIRIKDVIVALISYGWEDYLPPKLNNGTDPKICRSCLLQVSPKPHENKFLIFF